MKKTLAVKSTKAIFNILVMVGVFILVGLYFFFTYKDSTRNLMITGLVMVIIGLGLFLFNLPSLFSPTYLVEVEDQYVYIHTFFKKELKIAINDIVEVKSILTIRRYLRPLNYGYYTYGTLIIKTEHNKIYIPNCEDLKEIEITLQKMLKDGK